MAEKLASVIRRAKRLEPEAFDYLVDAYSARLYGFFWHMTGARDDAEELVQEVFVRVVRRIAAYEHDDRFDAWLFRIAANLARDRVRKIARQPRVASLDGTDGIDDETATLSQRIGDPSSGPSGRMELRENVDRMREALTELPPKEREVIMLRHFGHMTFQEIAGLMDTPLGTALARAHRGLAKLRTIMEAG